MSDAFITRRGGGQKPNFIVEQITTTATLPSTADENTILVVSDTEIVGYILSQLEPFNPVIGQLWIRTGVGSVTLPVTKEGNFVYHLSVCEQWNGTAWKAIDGHIYQNDAWVQFSTAVLYLYTPGDECTDITGGWAAKAMDAGGGASTYLPTITRNTSNIVFTASGENNGGAVYLANKIDLTDYSTLRFEVTVSGAGGQFDIWTEISSSLATNRVSATPVSTNMSVDISSITGLHNLGFYLASNSGTAGNITLEKMWME